MEEIVKVEQNITPMKQIESAKEKAILLKDIVEQAGLARNLGGTKKHLEMEGWQIIATFHGCTTMVDWTRIIEHDGVVVGYEARVNVVNSDGRVVSSAEAMCTFGEKNWTGKPIFQLRSMAQTRAASKACRMVFSWVVVLAGYSPTPYEEMTGDEYKNGKKESEPEPKKESVQLATEKQRKLIFAKSKEAGIAIPKLKEWCDKESSSEWTVDDINMLLEKIAEWKGDA